MAAWPPISLAEVKAAETAHGFSLPEDYRTFITEIADGCTKFISPSSSGTGGVFYSLKEIDGLPNLDKPFYFTESSKELQRTLTNAFGPYGIKNPVRSSMSASLPRESPLRPVWRSSDYSVLYGVLPFAVYNDVTFFDTQACLVLNGPLKGQVWLARKHMLKPGKDGGNFFAWMVEALEDGAC